MNYRQKSCEEDRFLVKARHEVRWHVGQLCHAGWQRESALQIAGQLLGISARRAYELFYPKKAPIRVTAEQWEAIRLRSIEACERHERRATELLTHIISRRLKMTTELTEQS